jgi:hypothetical protein
MVLGALAAAAVAAAPVRDSATIVNSGSTNFSGYTIQVWSDGSASAATSNRGTVTAATPKPFTLEAPVTKQFFTDLATAKSKGASIEPCMKSASFGTTTRLTWHDWTSPDLSCPPGNASAAALVHDVQVITAASGVSASLRHSFGPEMRRPPGLSPNTPEPSPTAS